MTTLNENTTLERGTLIINIVNPEWGTWRITKTPTAREDWYEKRGDSGENILFKDELRFWKLSE